MDVLKALTRAFNESSKKRSGNCCCTMSRNCLMMEVKPWAKKGKLFCKTELIRYQYVFA